MLSIGRKGESTNEMIGRPLWKAFSFLQEVSLEEVDVHDPWPMGRPCHVVCATDQQER